MLYQLAGKRDAANQYWESAIKANGKLVAARINLAMNQLVELRKIASNDPKRRTVESDARFSLSNALAVDPDNVAHYTLYALIYMEGADRNKNRLDLARLLLDEAKRRDDKSPTVHNAYGVLAVRKRSSAIAEFRAAAGDPDAAFNLALFSLRLHLFDDASRQLAAIKPATAIAYDHQIATAVALRGQRKLAEAEAAYQRAIKLDPMRPEAYFDLGLLLRNHLGAAAQPEQAIPFYQRAIEMFDKAAAAAANQLKLDAESNASDCRKVIVQLETYLKAVKKP